MGHKQNEGWKEAAACQDKVFEFHLEHAGEPSGILGLQVIGCDLMFRIFAGSHKRMNYGGGGRWVTQEAVRSVGMPLP